MDTQNRKSNGLLGIWSDGQTYRNMAYLLLSFPLGIVYFVFAVTGISLGVGLLPIFIGIPILLFVLLMAKGAVDFERAMAAKIVLDHGPPDEGSTREPHIHSYSSFWSTVRSVFSDPQVYKGLLLLFVKFPLGIAGFVLAVTLPSVSLSMILAPLVYLILDATLSVQIFADDVVLDVLLPSLSPLERSWLCAAAGVVLAFITLHLLNFFAKVSANIVLLLTEG